jgi:hypothetical protein
VPTGWAPEPFWIQKYSCLLNSLAISTNYFQNWRCSSRTWKFDISNTEAGYDSVPSSSDPHSLILTSQLLLGRTIRRFAESSAIKIVYVFILSPHKPSLEYFPSFHYPKNYVCYKNRYRLKINFLKFLVLYNKLAWSWRKVHNAASKLYYLLFVVVLCFTSLEF